MNIVLILAKKLDLLTCYAFKDVNDFKAFMVQQNISFITPRIYNKEGVWAFSNKTGAMPGELARAFTSEAVANKALMNFYARQPEITRIFNVYRSQEQYLIAAKNSEAVSEILKERTDAIALSTWLDKHWKKAVFNLSIPNGNKFEREAYKEKIKKLEEHVKILSTRSQNLAYKNKILKAANA